MLARKAILVEDMSDVLAVRAMAARAGRDLEAEGIAVIALGGGGGLDARLKQLGPSGRGLELVGLCDVDHEARWARSLEAAGLGSRLDRAAMQALGFFVCDRDLEDELIKTIGVARVESVIAAEGELGAGDPRAAARSPGTGIATISSAVSSARSPAGRRGTRRCSLRRRHRARSRVLFARCWRGRESFPAARRGRHEHHSSSAPNR